MTPEQLSDAIVAALSSLSDEGSLRLPDGVPDQVVVERPRSKEHGDYATNVALQLGKKAGFASPRDLAELLAGQLAVAEGIAKVDIAGPGFLNITVAADSQGQVAADVVAAGTSYGRTDTQVGHNVNLEFVSANPTGPVTLASARWAAVGDAVARLIESTGARVSREYYFNDHGAQVDRLARSLLAWSKGEEVPEDGYLGSYVEELAQQVLVQHPEIVDLDDAAAQDAFRQYGVELMFAEIKASLHDFGVDFEVYFHENDLHRSGAVQRAVDRLTELGNTYEKDGALWLATEKFGDDKDRVIIRSDGNGSYLSGDLAYYLNKRERGFDRCLILLGADHHGYVGRLMAMCAAFGDEPGVNLEIIIGQMVNLLSHGSVVRMGKRTGNIVTLDDLVERIGNDAARYALVRNSMDGNLDIDVDLWTKATSDNPVFYVQYAHARLASILRNAAELGVPAGGGGFDPALLCHEKEGNLLRALAEFPRVVAGAAQLREPHRVARYLEETASSFHKFYDSCRVLPMGDEEPNDLHRSRLVLVEATRVVLANGLRMLGVSTPDRM
ncbi:MAG: arginine--tRNA ligase [Actinomycetota bacterium]|nr:arginine--tRNA ligase [Actinomycetota bacterium]